MLQKDIEAVDEFEKLLSPQELSQAIGISPDDINTMAKALENPLPCYEMPPVRGKGLRVRRKFNLRDVKEYLKTKPHQKGN